MKAGDKVIRRETQQEETVKSYMPGGLKASDIFNQPMLVTEESNEWLPLTAYIQPQPQ